MTDEKKPTIRRSRHVKADDRRASILEAIDGGFITANSETLAFLPRIELEDRIILPVERDNVPYELYSQPNELVPDIGQIYSKLYAIVDDYWDHDEVFYKHIISCFIVGSYLQEGFMTVPYLFFFGDNESGKTRGLELIAKMGYRPLFGISIPAADIFSFLKDEPGSLICEDEIQGLEREGEKIKIYKEGYKRGASAPRITTLPSGQRKVEYYPCFGLKAIASERLPSDFLKGFKERLIVIQCIEGEPRYDEYREQDEDAMREIRNELLAWRVTHYSSLDLPAIDGELKGRMREKWKPLLQVAKLIGGEPWDRLSKIVGTMVRSRLEEKRASFEGRLVKVCLEAVNEMKSLEISFDAIWERVREEFDGLIDLDRKPNEMNTPDLDRPLTKNYLGRRITEILNAKIKRNLAQGRRTVVYRVFDEAKLARAAKRYHYDPPQIQVITELLKLPNPEGQSIQKPSPIPEVSPPEGEKDGGDTLTIGNIGNSVISQNGEITCGDCEHHTLVTCAKIKPFAGSCHSFAPKTTKAVFT